MRYLNAYLTEQQYGGPEEGGWWYDTGIPLASVPLVDGISQSAIDRLKQELKDIFKDREWGKKHSAMGGEIVEVYVEDHFAEYFPKEKPHYE
jgi:hypothetical protein